MSLPFNLQRLPPEAISVLRYLGRRNAAATTHDMDENLDIGTRAIGRAIRRLVNYSLIQMDFNSAYQLTGDGRRAYQQLAESELTTASKPSAERKAASITRRLTIVLPHSVVLGQPIALYIGINPPSNGDTPLPQTAHLELRLSAVGGEFSETHLGIEVPPDKAAAPARVTLAARQAARAIRIRIDAFQVAEIDRIHSAGAMYFDLPVVPQPTGEEPTRRAVGVDLALS